MNSAGEVGSDLAEALRDCGANHPQTGVAPSGAEWTGSGRELQSVPDRFAQIVEAGPDRPAIRTPEGCISYSELDRESDRIAAALAGDSRGAGRPVAILMDMSPGFLFAVLGALKAGRCYVPLSTGAPPESNREIMDSAEVAVLLVESEQLAQAAVVAGDSRAVVDIGALPVASPGWRRAAVSPDAIAYIIYTSGSSGLPKGVYQNQGNLVRYARLQAEVMELSTKDGVAWSSPPGVFGTVNSIFSALLNGAALCLINVAKVGFPQLRASLQEGHITVFALYVTLFRRFAATLDGTEDFRAVRLLRLVGEATTAADFARYRSIFGAHCRLMVSFGSTETMAVCARYYDVRATQEDATLSPGLPIPGVELSILDDQGRPLPAGETGEIAVSSDYLSLGYWKRPELSCTTFLERGGRRTFLTGDLGMIRPDGSLVHLGRRDMQVKIRGFRVEVPAVELALERVAGIAESCVVGARNANQETELLAWYVPADGRPVAGLRSLLGGALPAHMVPARLFALREMPRTASGKPDRALLGDPEFPVSALFRELALDQRRYVAPKNPLERELIGEWEKILMIDGIGAEDNFVDLGGDSLSYVAAHLSLERRLGSVPHDWGSRSIRDLAALSGRKGIVRMLDTSILIRACAIVLIVASHANFFTVARGSTGALFLVTGYLLSQFQVPQILRHQGSKPLLRLAGKILLPVLAYTLLITLVGAAPHPSMILLSSNFVELRTRGVEVHMWYVHAMLQMLLLLALLMASPRLRHALSIRPYVTCVLLFLALATIRFLSPALVSLLDDGAVMDVAHPVHRLPTTHLATLVLGMCMYFSDTWRERAFTLLLLCGDWILTETILDTPYTMLLLFGVLLLYVREVPVIPPVKQVAYVLAGASLFVYLTQFLWMKGLGVVGIDLNSNALRTLVCLVCGVLAWTCWNRLQFLVHKLRKRRDDSVVIDAV